MPDGAHADLSAFYDELELENLAPLWERLKKLVPREPVSRAVPVHWQADRLRQYIMEAGRLITAEQAERRVVVLENPGLKGQSQVTTSLYAGIQLILPGEVAPTHRHSASALRLIMEGEGAYSIVDGERVSMHPGDFLITPTWSLHDHGSDGDGPVIWLDGLDVPTINMFSAGFFEDVDGVQQRITKPTGDSVARYASGLVPVRYQPVGVSSPVFLYPWSRTREALEQMRRLEDWDESEGLRLAFTDPTTGRSPIATMGAFMQLLPAGFAGSPIRSTDGTVYSVVSGHGRVTVGNASWDLGSQDVFVVPSWIWHNFSASEDLVLFSFSDRPIQKHLGIWREQRRADTNKWVAHS